MGAKPGGTTAMRIALDFGENMTHIPSWFREKEVGFTYLAYSFFIGEIPF
jgi:hypothetical protein